MRLVLLGPPGAGKGTQATRLAERFHLAHLSSGDILRAERAAGSDLGRKAQHYMDAGQLVPDDLIVQMMAEHMARAGAGGGFLLDGFPRTLAQAQALDQRMAQQHSQLDAVINLKVSDQLVEQRLTNRWICPSCARVYHLQNSPPRQAGRCDADGETLIQRPDDRPEVVRHRLQTYHAQTEPIVAYYHKRSLLQNVNGDGGIEAVGQQMEQIGQALAKKR